MGFVIKVITVGLSICLFTFTGCRKEQPKPSFNLVPETVTPLPMGFIKSVSPAAFVDSVNSGAKLKMFFVQDAQPMDPSQIPYIPNIRTVELGQMYFIAETLSHADPIFLVGLYTSDSRRLAKELSSRGFNCYFLDGGTYLLTSFMKERKLVFSTQSGNPENSSKKEQP